MHHYQVPLLSFYMVTLLVGCGGSSTSNQSPKPIQSTIPTTNVDIDISEITISNLSLPTGWETSNQSLIVNNLANVESSSRITADIANQMPIIQSAKVENASLARSKQFADNVVNNLTTIKNHHYPGINKTITFTGTKTSELLPLLANDTKVVINNTIEVDTIVNINGLKNILVECQNAATFTGKQSYENTPSYRPIFLNNKGMVNQVTSTFAVNNAEHIQIKGCGFENTQAVIIDNSKYLNLKGLMVKNSTGYGVIIGKNNQNVIVDKSIFSNNYGSGILALSNNKNLVLINNQIDNSQGYSAWQSGIVITDKKPARTIGQTDFLFHNDYLMPALDMNNIENKSSDIYILKNTIRNQTANGILLDGVKNAVISDNQIRNNNREGVELLNSHSIIVNKNNIVQNGRVLNVPTEILQRQFPISFRNEADGSNRLKDSGIALDNTAYNLISHNTIDNNYGSGIYAKRATFYNVIAENSINNNNLSKIDNTVLWYNGININSMPQMKASNLIKFAPSMGNIIYKNTITGTHQNGIELCIYCEDNEVLENTITSPLVYSIKQYIPRQQNLFKDNQSNAKSENTNLNSNGSGTANAGSVVTMDWGSQWLNDRTFRNINTSQNNLFNVNNLFIGSSTIRMWDLNRDFPNYHVANRGFGGAESFDVKVHLKTLLGNSQPKTIIVYVGENDIASGKGLERTLYHLQQNLAYLQLFRPNAKLTYIGIKPSSSRASKEQPFLTLNQFMQKYTQNHQINYIDTTPLVKNSDGTINDNLFLGDKLHLNQAGYARLANVVRPYLQ